MDVLQALSEPAHAPILCLEMHTCGEPTRIILKNHPPLSGTLLQQRIQAKQQYDHIRRRLMLEPRGHADMYGAILVPATELTETGESHIGVLFTHNEGFSAMCGHATIALGRFLVDTRDEEVFPGRSRVVIDEADRTATVNLHAPCGNVVVTVPVTAEHKSDPSRPVSFVSVACFVTALDLEVQIPAEYRWSALGARTSVVVDVSFGGAFTCLISAQELGFGETGLKQGADLAALSHAANMLKQALTTTTKYDSLFTHPQHKELDTLYTTVVVDKALGKPAKGSKGAETGLCFFADQQIDRSPTGSAVGARLAVAYARGELKLGESWTYHSLVSDAMDGEGGFVGTPFVEDETFSAHGIKGVRVKVEGHAYYTGFHTFVVEEEDRLGKEGFLFSSLRK